MGLVRSCDCLCSNHENEHLDNQQNFIDAQRLFLRSNCAQGTRSFCGLSLSVYLLIHFHFISFPIRRVALQPELIYKGPSTKKYNNLQKPYILKEPNIQVKNKPNTKVQLQK